MVASGDRRARGQCQVRCFNPLHCGAVVASLAPSYWRSPQPHVSIPFIAGQWSLQALKADLQGCAVMFQSPSLRGSGRFPQTRVCRSTALLRRVSIPFIAGQWSLPLDLTVLVWTGFTPSQSPSLRGSGRFGGAARRGGARSCGSQSPSLRGSGRFCNVRLWHVAGFVFQSPSLRGSGRFGGHPGRGGDADSPFQSPSLRGSGRFMKRTTIVRVRLTGFQSPSLRGSGRFLSSKTTVTG